MGLRFYGWRERKETEEKGSDIGRWRKTRWKEDGTELHALEKPQVARDLTTGEWSRIMVNLFDLGVQLINIITKLCVLYTGSLGLEIYHTLLHLVTPQKWKVSSYC